MPRYSSVLLNSVTGDEFKSEVEGLVKPAVEQWQANQQQEQVPALPRPTPAMSLPTLADLGWEDAKEAVTQAAGSVADAASGAVQGVADAGRQAVEAATTALPDMVSLGWDDPTPSAPSVIPGPDVSPESGTPIRSAAEMSARTGQDYGPIDNSSRQAFVRTAYPYMLDAAEGNRDLAEMMLAKAISENGDVGKGGGFVGNNFSGIKGKGSAGSFTADTWEQVDGQRVPQRAEFAAYNTPQEGFRAFLGFLRDNPRYAEPLAEYQRTGDATQLIRGINAKGYATDTGWADTIANIRENQVAPITRGLAAPAPRGPQPAAMPEQASQSFDVQGITKQYEGKPYVFGGAGGRSDMRPGVATDCSGFVASVWRNTYGVDLAAHTDTSYNQLRELGAPEVGPSEARAGDVVYYLGAGTGGAIAHHMGIYAGPGKVLDMSTGGTEGVRVRDIGHAGKYVVLRDPRVNPEQPRRPATPPEIVPTGYAERSPTSRVTPAQVDAVIEATPNAGSTVGTSPSPSGTSAGGVPPAPPADASRSAAEISAAPTSLDDARASYGASEGDMQRQPLSQQPELPADDVGAADIPALEGQPFDPDSGPREATPGSVGAQILSAPKRNEDIPGPDLGPGGFPIVDQPPSYGPPLSEAGPEAPAPEPEQPSSPFKPLYDAAGQVVGYVQSQVDKIPPVPRLPSPGEMASNVSQGRTPAGQTPGQYARAVTPRPSALAGSPEAALRDVIDLPRNLPNVPAAVDQSITDVADAARSSFRTASQDWSDGYITNAVINGAWGALQVANAPFEVGAETLDAALPTLRIGQAAMNVTTPRDIKQVVDGVRKLATAGVKITGPVVAALKQGTAADDLIALATRGANAAADTIDRGIEGVQGAGRRINEGIAANAERTAAADARIAADGAQPAYAAAGMVPEAAPHVYSPTPPAGTQRRYHGTAGAFDAADPAKFDENGLYGPGYYTTSDPRVASSYGTARQQITDQGVEGLERVLANERKNLGAEWAQSPETQERIRATIAELEERIRVATPSAGPNVRPIDIPPDVKLIDADAPLTEDVLARVGSVIDRLETTAPDIAADMRQEMARAASSAGTNDALITGLMEAAERGSGKGLATEVLERAGFDGIAHTGGQRVPMLDGAGQPIEHDVSVIFPGSVNKVRNAFSGTYGGAGAGVLPPGGPAATDRLGAVNNVLAQGLASTFSGGTAAAYADQMGDPNDPHRQAKAFVAGALVPQLATRGMGALAARRLGRGAERAEGALATFGAAPGRRTRQPGQTFAVGSKPGERFEFRVKVVPLSDLVTSHTDALAINRAFPSELQPRVRERAASRLQIDRIVNEFDPEQMLVDFHTVDRGPMIVGPDNVVESGNGRSIALRRLAKEKPEEYARYVEDLKATLQDYGLSEDAIKGIDQPVLVRERLTDVDRVRFAADANVGVQAGMSPIERATQTAGRLSDDTVSRIAIKGDESIDAALLSSENEGLRRAFLATVPETEWNDLLQADGNLNPDGLNRLKSALLVKTYQGDAGLRLATAFVESTDPGIANVERGIYASLPAMARAEARIASGEADAGLSIASDVAQAADVYSRLRRARMSVPDYVAQAPMFGGRETTPLQDRILGYFAENSRAPSRIRAILDEYASAVEQFAPAGADDMFGGAVATASKDEVLDGVLRRLGRGVGAADEGAELGRAGAGGQVLAGPAPGPRTVPEPPAGAAEGGGAGSQAGLDLPPAPAEPARRPVTRPGPVGEDFAPTGGPEGTLAQEGAPTPLASPTRAERGTLPTGGAPGALAVEGQPPAPPRPIAEVLDELPASLNTPQLRRALTGAQRRQEAMERRGLESPSAWDWLKQAGYAGIYGPATLVNSAVGGAQELLLGQPKEAVRALASGRPGNYLAQAGAQLRAMPDGLAGLGRVLFGSDSAAAARASGGSQGTANLSERVVNPVGHFAARLLERPGEILTEAPDAVFRPAFAAQGMQREAGTIAAELGLRGSKAQAYADELMQMAENLRANPDTPVASSTARRIVEAGEKYADEVGYKGKPGAFGQWLGQTAKRDDAIGVLASFLVPFPSMAARMSTAAARSTPLVGLLPSVRRGQATKFDVVYDQAFGTAVAGGLAYWAFSGGITGSGPADKEKRDAMISQGWQPNSTLVAGHYIPNRVFGRFQPMFDTAGELHDALAYGKKDQKPSEMAADLVKRGTRIATDQTGLSGLADLHDMLTQGFASQFPGWAARSATRYVPYAGVLRAAANALDPTQRRPEGWRDVGLQEALRQQASTAVPGLRQGVPAAQDILGREAPNPQQGLGALVPRITTRKDDPTIGAFTQAGVDIGAPPDKITIDTIPVELTPAERRQWQKYRGEILEKYASGMPQRPWWQRREARKAGAEQLLEEANKAAGERIQKTIGAPELRRRIRDAVADQKKAS